MASQNWSAFSSITGFFIGSTIYLDVLSSINNSFVSKSVLRIPPFWILKLYFTGSGSRITTYGCAINFFDTSYDFGRNHNGITIQHLLEHKNSKVEIVDKTVSRITPRIVRCQRLIGRVATTGTGNKFGGIFFVIKGLSIVNSMYQNIRNFSKIPSYKMVNRKILILIFQNIGTHFPWKHLPSPDLTMLRSWTFSPNSIVLPDLTRLANNSVPGSLRKSPISLRNSCPPPM